MKIRFQVLDGWRGLSIIFVIVGHWFPLGPSAWKMNHTLAGTGMVIFFILSGFLITNALIYDKNIASFLTRRLFRVVPLAWLILLITLLIYGKTSYQWFSNFFFISNLPPMGLVKELGLYWSLCLEVQFYLCIAFLIKIFKNKTFWLLPILGLAITSYRIYHGELMNIRTYYRADEILAGCSLALLYASNFNPIKDFIGNLNSPLLLLVLIASANPYSETLNYLRPYLAMLLVGSTLFAKHEKWWIKFLKNKTLFYIASISYALYLFHGLLDNTWLGQGTTLEKYIKRPILVLVTTMLAHISTNYYEKYWIDKGRKIANKFKVKTISA